LAQAVVFRCHPLAAMPITLDGTPTSLNKEVQWICDVTQDLWICIPDHLQQSSTRLPIQRSMSVGAPSQGRRQNVIHRSSPSGLNGSGNVINRDLFLSLLRKASVSTPEQQLFKTVLLPAQSLHEVAAEQSGFKTPQPTPLGCKKNQFLQSVPIEKSCKKEAFLRSAPIEKSFNLSFDRVAAMAVLPPLKLMKEDVASCPTSIGNLSTLEQLPTMADYFTDDALPILV